FEPYKPVDIIVEAQLHVALDVAAAVDEAELAPAAGLDPALHALAQLHVDGLGVQLEGGRVEPDNLFHRAAEHVVDDRSGEDLGRTLAEGPAATGDIGAALSGATEVFLRLAGHQAHQAGALVPALERAWLHLEVVEGAGELQLHLMLVVQAIGADTAGHQID